jgi:acetamidase/formamidase
MTRLDAAADTVHWGYFDARLAPVLTIDSGERVTISTVSGPPEILPKVTFPIDPALPAIHAANGPQRFFGHMCTGPDAADRHRSDRAVLRMGPQRDPAAVGRAAG